MDMDNMYTLLDEFQAMHGWRFRYVANKWWGWDVDTRSWRQFDARENLSRAFLSTAEMIWDEAHVGRRQVSRDYMVTGLCARLVPHLRSDSLEGDPRPGTWVPATESRPPSGSPAPADQLTQDQTAGQRPLKADPSQELADPAGTGG